MRLRWLKSGHKLAVAAGLAMVLLVVLFSFGYPLLLQSQTIISLDKIDFVNPEFRDNGEVYGAYWIADAVLDERDELYLYKKEDISSEKGLLSRRADVKISIVPLRSQWTMNAVKKHVDIVSEYDSGGIFGGSTVKKSPVGFYQTTSQIWYNDVVYRIEVYKRTGTQWEFLGSKDLQLKGNTFAVDIPTREGTVTLKTLYAAARKKNPPTLPAGVDGVNGYDVFWDNNRNYFVLKHGSVSRFAETWNSWFPFSTYDKLTKFPPEGKFTRSTYVSNNIVGLKMNSQTFYMPDLTDDEIWNRDEIYWDNGHVPTPIKGLNTRYDYARDGLYWNYSRLGEGKLSLDGSGITARIRVSIPSEMADTVRVGEFCGKPSITLARWQRGEVVEGESNTLMLTVKNDGIADNFNIEVTGTGFTDATTTAHIGAGESKSLLLSVTVDDVSSKTLRTGNVEVRSSCDVNPATAQASFYVADRSDVGTGTLHVKATYNGEVVVDAPLYVDGEFRANGEWTGSVSATEHVVSTKNTTRYYAPKPRTVVVGRDSETSVELVMLDSPPQDTGFLFYYKYFLLGLLLIIAVVLFDRYKVDPQWVIVLIIAVSALFVLWLLYDFFTNTLPESIVRGLDGLLW